MKTDSAWKMILKELFEDFLLFFMPDLYELVDFSVQPKFLDQEFEELFPESKAENRKVDKLIEVKLKNHESLWVLVHTEIQSYPDQAFEKRMFDYYLRIFDRYQRDIEALAIFTYEGDYHKKNFYERKLLQTKLTYTYRTYDVAKQDEKLLLNTKNPFSLVVYVAKKAIKHLDDDLNNYNFKKETTKLLLDSGYNGSKIVSIFKFLNFIFNIKNEELSYKLREEVREMALKNEIHELSDYEDLLIKEGMLKGKVEGKIEGKIETLSNKALKLLNKKLGSLPKEIELKIQTCTDIAVLDNIIDNIFEIENLETLNSILG